MQYLRARFGQIFRRKSPSARFTTADNIVRSTDRQKYVLNKSIARRPRPVKTIIKYRNSAAVVVVHALLDGKNTHALTYVRAIFRIV